MSSTVQNGANGDEEITSTFLSLNPYRLSARLRSDTVGSGTSTLFSLNPGDPVPTNTPATQSVVGEPVEYARPVDGNRLGDTLGVIEEHHNDAITLDFGADPTNPENTPLNSPPASQYARLRAIPSFTSHLNELCAAEDGYNSPHSITPPASDEEDADEEDGIIHIGLGSPRELAASYNLVGQLGMVEQGTLDSPAFRTPRPEPTPRKPATAAVLGRQDAVYEHQDWATAILEDVDQSLARLENLALDDYNKNRSVSHVEHYKKRLMAAFTRKNRLDPYDISHIPCENVGISGYGAMLVTSYSHNKLKESHNKLNQRVMEMEATMSEMKREMAKIRKALE